MERARARAVFWVAGLLFWAALPGPAPRPPAPPRRPPHGAAGLLFGRPLDPNRAAPQALEALPGIGPERARAIVRQRARRPFCRLGDLGRVPGIGPVTVRRLRPWLRVRPPPGCPSPPPRARRLMPDAQTG